MSFLCNLVILRLHLDFQGCIHDASFFVGWELIWHLNVGLFGQNICSPPKNLNTSPWKVACVVTIEHVKRRFLVPSPLVLNFVCEVCVFSNWFLLGLFYYPP